jgi:Ran GTPase-activating protein (RanGAP) involved in mRNA processing and transport
VLGLTTACVNQGGLGTPRTGASITTTDTDDQPTVALPPSNPVVSSHPANPTQEGSTITHLPGTAVPETVPSTSHLPIALPASNPATQPQLGPTIYDLPKDLFAHICSFLEPEALHKFLSTCKQFYSKRVTEPDSSRLSTALGLKINSVRKNEGKSCWGYFDRQKNQFKRVPPSLYPLVRKISRVIPLQQGLGLGLANFPKLRELTLDFVNCKISNIDLVLEVLNQVKESQNLESLVISYLPTPVTYSKFPKGMFESLTEIIQKNNIKKLEISHNYLGSEKEERKNFLGAVIVPSSLEELDLSLNGLLSEDINCLTEALKTNQTLRVLNLCSNKIDDQGAKEFAEALKNNKTLLELDLKGNRIVDEGAGHIAEALELNTGLKYINLSDNKMSYQGLEVILKALKNNKNLQVIGLGRNSISHEETKQIVNLLAEFLKKNTSLKGINLSDNYITPTEIEHLVEALKHNKTLQMLDLEDNKIGDEGVKILAEFLKINDTLQVLNLARNKISKKGIEYLFETLKNNKSLLELDLRGHSIDEEFANELAKMLPLIIEKSNLRKLHLSYQITSNGQTINHGVRDILVQALRGNKRLQLFFSW